MKAPLQALAQEFLQESPPYRLLRGDGSERKIYRLTPKRHRFKSLIGVWHQDVEENQAFLSLTEEMRKIGLPVPEVYAVAPDRSCYLLTDLGEYNLAQMAERWAREGERSALLQAYKQVIELMPLLQVELPKKLKDFLAYKQMGEEAFAEDLAYFQTNFLQRLGLAEHLPVEVKAELQEHLVVPLTSLGGQFFVYRDFQARNLMYLKGKIYLIDYQSALSGSRYYDLASLLFASKSGLHPAEREPLLRHYFSVCQPEPDYATFERRFYLFVLLRRLRSLGSYGYLGVKMQKAGFVESIAPTLHELTGLFSHKKALAPFQQTAFFLAQIQDQWPAIEAQITKARPPTKN